MKVAYDKYYQTENLFGYPYPELLAFFSKYPNKGTVLDLGCGQGRDAIPLAQMGFEVTGIDNSKVGIEQINQLAKSEKLPLKGIVADIFEFSDFGKFDFVLLDSMFHFTKKDKQKETNFIKTILTNINKDCLLIICIQDTGKKVAILNKTIDFKNKHERIIDQKFVYTFEDTENGHKSKTNYRMLVIKK